MSGMNVVARFQLLDQFSAQAARIEMSANRLRTSMGATANSAGFLGGALKGMGIAAVAMGMLNMTKQAVEFESAMANINKVMTLTKTQFAEIRADILKLGRELPVALSELAKVGAVAGQAGIDQAEVADFITTVSKMSTAFDIPAVEAAENLTRIRNNFKLTAKDAVSLADAMNAMGNATVAKEKDILDFTTRAAGTASLVKITAQELAAVGTGIISLTGRSEVAARFINAAFSKFANMGEFDPKKQAKAVEALKTLGLTGKEMVEGMQVSAPETLIKFLEAVGKVDKIKRAPIMSALFGAGWQDDMAQALGGLQTMKDALKLADAPTNAGSLNREFAKRMDTTAAQIELLKNAFTELGVVIGDSLLGPIKSAAGYLTDMVQTLTGGIKTLQSVGDYWKGDISREEFNKQRGVEDADPYAATGGGPIVNGMRDIARSLDESIMGWMQQDKKPVEPPNVNVVVNVDKSGNQTQTVTNNGAPLNTGKGDAGSFSNGY